MFKRLLIVCLPLTVFGCIKEEPSKPKQYIPTIAETYEGKWLITDTIIDTDPQGQQVQYRTDTGLIKPLSDTTARFQNFFPGLCRELNAYLAFNIITPIRDPMCNEVQYLVSFSAIRTIDLEHAIRIEYAVANPSSIYPIQVRSRAVKK